MRHDQDLLALPSDTVTAPEAKRLDLDPAVVVRDVVRLAEMHNLSAQGFFNEKSVLAGSMALRCFGSPRFTVLDADFSTLRENVDPKSKITDLLHCESPSLSISVESDDVTPHDAGETNWKAMPVTFDARFSDLIGERQSRFKADISVRGLELDGIRKKVRVPYNLGLWAPGNEPEVWVMDPHEIVAEKVLGWCAGRHYKHYADLAFIAEIAQPGEKAPPLPLDDEILREVLAAKRKTMADLQPGRYSHLPTIEAVVSDLGRPPAVSAEQWSELTYIQKARGIWTRDKITANVRGLLVPRLRTPRHQIVR